jgi:2OG-Fe(II) oxygenase superfamily
VASGPGWRRFCCQAKASRRAEPAPLGSAPTPTSGPSPSSTGSRAGGACRCGTAQDGWEDAPYEPGALTINAGDLLARWSGGRWKSNRHRVLPPQAEAPDEDLVSLVYFYEADHDTVIESLRPPIGKPNSYAPVVSAQFLKERLDAITIG